MLEALIDSLGDGGTLMLSGAVVGVIFGAAAQRSRFCLRAATVEVASGRPGPSLAIWLIAFFSAVLSVQAAIVAGWLDVDEARQLAATGSLSGAVIGGLMFGAGMILARGCASRLLVLASTGNLRALVSGLVLTLVAQAALSGVLARPREALSALWTVPGGTGRDLLAMLGAGHGGAALFAAAALMLAVGYAAFCRVEPGRAVAGAIVGVAVGLGWGMTYWISQASFEIVPVASITFTGPSTDTLMGLVTAPRMPASFGVGLVPGVMLGSFAMAVFRREFRIERFGPDTPMERYLLGACLMGFGAMLAGGCAVGAGMSGGSVFSLTAWVAAFAMWAGAMVTHRLLMGSGSQAVVRTP
ncbi:YeeE/YedE family protein [Ovoidimarina sediminis]|uniref:YeeE/YedE family protein n=1 Tax=Ovoidimarina sediminis TaxID=3079856 RepID=UPI0029147F91|nr:YeeE/YedE family protein [Rhodophyticola sp. MJ-SS7]MDU8942679.1 YeeE/YedE family protein [Rhodophyticola sp. MJ-SS7]